jgi:hypothetical protein
VLPTSWQAVEYADIPEDGTDSVTDAVGMEAHGTDSVGMAQKLRELMEAAG